MQQRRMTRTPIAFKVNGEDVEVLVKPWQTLLEVLRDELRLTGTKEGLQQRELRCLHRPVRRQGYRFLSRLGT